MGGLVRIDRQAIDDFNRYWEGLYRAFPYARQAAVEAMGRTVLQDLYGNIVSADLEGDASLHVGNWQRLRLGSGGGYAAISPRSGAAVGGSRQTKWRGTPTTARNVTRWLEKGHGVRQPAAGSSRRWNRVGRSGINDRTGKGFVKGRQFYSSTKLKAVDHALAAAERLLEKIDEEVDWE